jgi:hypothetical protein
MQWFKHKTDAHDDPVVSEAWDTFGPDGYVVWFVLLELYGRHFKASKPGAPLVANKSYFARKFRKRWVKVELILNYYQGFDKINLTVGEERVVIRIVNFADITSNWTKRQIGKPTEGGTEAPTAREKEKEKDKEKEKEKSPRGVAPALDYQDASLLKINNEIKQLTEQLYRQGIFPKVNAFVATMLKHSKNERAVLHALDRCFQKKPTDPWAYCLRIMQVENGNYNEAEHREEAKRQQENLDKFMSEFGS